MRKIWLASYPKSGNTWMRVLIGCLSLPEGAELDLNKLPMRDGIASARGPFDFFTLIDSGLLTHDEIDALRPAVYQAQARGGGEEGDEPQPAMRFVKVHDAYTYLPNGEALLAGAKGADGAVVIVRDPRDIAASFANHSARDLDSTIARMANPGAAFASTVVGLPSQLRQRLLGWSSHVESWLDQRDIPVHLLRYEDLLCDTAGNLAGVLAFAGLSVRDADIQRAVSLARFSTLRAFEQANGFGEAPSHRQSAGFFRRGEAGAWREELTAQQVARIEADHAAVMMRLGYQFSSRER